MFQLRLALLSVGFVASFLFSGCTKIKPVFVVTKPSPVPRVTARPAAPIATVTATAPLHTTGTPSPGEFVSLQDPDLTISDMKDSPTRIGRIVTGTLTNRGVREYGIVHLRLDFFDAHGAKVGNGSDFTQRFGPGNQWIFNINMFTDSVSYKVTELRGDWGY